MNILCDVLANQNLKHIKKITNHDHIGFAPWSSWLHFRDARVVHHAQINKCNHHIYDLKDRNHTVITIDSNGQDPLSLHDLKKQKQKRPRGAWKDGSSGWSICCSFRRQFSSQHLHQACGPNSSFRWIWNNWTGHWAPALTCTHTIHNLIKINSNQVLKELNRLNIAQHNEGYMW